MTTYDIRIDRENCVGDGLCREEAPGTFDVDGEGKSVVMNPDGDPAEDILRAAQSCPLNVITLLDTRTGATVCP